MCTLTTQFGITWKIVSLAGRAGFVHNGCIIVFSHQDRKYHMVRRGASLLTTDTIGDCLDIGSEMILDAYASGITPMWDNLSIDIEVEEESPDTERVSSNYAPWATAA